MKRLLCALVACLMVVPVSAGAITYSMDGASMVAGTNGFYYADIINGAFGNRSMVNEGAIPFDAPDTFHVLSDGTKLQDTAALLFTGAGGGLVDCYVAPTSVSMGGDSGYVRLPATLDSLPVNSEVAVALREGSVSHFTVGLAFPESAGDAAGIAGNYGENQRHLVPGFGSANNHPVWNNWNTSYNLVSRLPTGTGTGSLRGSWVGTATAGPIARIISNPTRTNELLYVGTLKKATTASWRFTGYIMVGWGVWAAQSPSDFMAVAVVKCTDLWVTDAGNEPIKFGLVGASGSLVCNEDGTAATAFTTWMTAAANKYRDARMISLVRTVVRGGYSTDPAVVAAVKADVANNPAYYQSGTALASPAGVDRFEDDLFYEPEVPTEPPPSSEFPTASIDASVTVPGFLSEVPFFSDALAWLQEQLLALGNGSLALFRPIALFREFIEGGA